jgi:Domain of unknown function (DUF1707)
MATQPSLRIGDRDREATAAELREHFAHGRLTLEEFNQRLDAVFEARTQRDLTRITADLPHVRTGGAPLPSSGTRPGPRRSGLPADDIQPGSKPTPGGRPGGGLVGYPVTGDWQGHGWQDHGWQDHGGQDHGGQGHGGHGRGGRGGFAAFLTLLAAIASWLLVYDVLLAGVQWPWAGRVGLLVAIFSLIRGLLRRIFGGGRSGGRGRRVPPRTRRRR